MSLLKNALVLSKNLYQNAFVLSKCFYSKMPLYYQNAFIKTAFVLSKCLYKKCIYIIDAFILPRYQNVFKIMLLYY